MGFSSPIALAALAIANLIPLGGVLFFQWDAGQIVLIYWIENLILGFFNVLKLLFAEGEGSAWGAKLGAALFFTVHYGIFCLVHGIFVVTLFSIGGDKSFGPESLFYAVLLALPPEHMLAVVALFVSHGLSFFLNYLGRGEFHSATIQELMSAPYGRVVVLHLAILFGGAFVMFLGSPAGLLILLVIGKIVLDMKFHLKEHANAREAREQ